MASVIDALIVSLNLDAKGFDAGQKKMVGNLRQLEGETAKTAAKMEESGKQAAEFFAGLRNQALALFGAFTAGKGAASFASYFTNVNSSIGRMSANLGLSTEQLSAWQGVGKRVGTTAEEVAGNFKTIASQVQALQMTGQLPGYEALAKAGVDLQKFTAASTSNEQRMLLLAEAFSKLDKQQAQYLGQQAGYSEGFVNLLTMGPSKLQAMNAEQVKSAALTKEQAAAAAKLQDQWQKLDATMTQIGNRVMEEMTPYLLEGIQSLQKMAEWW